VETGWDGVELGGMGWNRVESSGTGWKRHGYRWKQNGDGWNGVETGGIEWNRVETQPYTTTHLCGLPPVVNDRTELNPDCRSGILLVQRTGQLQPRKVQRPPGHHLVHPGGFTLLHLPGLLLVIGTVLVLLWLIRGTCRALYTTGYRGFGRSR